MIGGCAYHMKECNKKIAKYRPSLYICIYIYILIEELRVVEGLVTNGSGAD